MDHILEGPSWMALAVVMKLVEVAVVVVVVTDKVVYC